MQRISQLAPLAEILAYLDEAVTPVVPVNLEPFLGVGTTLVSDVIAADDWPSQAVAARDGWAVLSDHVLDASSYTPVRLDPPARWTEVGEPLPLHTDAILQADAVTETRAGPEASAPVTAGEGVAGTGTEVTKGTMLRRGGQRLRASDAAVLISCGITSIAVRRPRVGLVSTTVPALAATDTIAPVVSRIVEAAGGEVEVFRGTLLEEALLAGGVDAIVGIGGTGAGRQDDSAKTLARIGKLVWHGLGISPGGTAALGEVHSRPVLLLPGRFDAALAALLIVGTAVLDRLSARRDPRPRRQVKLTRKVTSTIGLAELLLLRRVPDGVEPLATGGLTLQALAQADGWGIVLPESEGLPAGSMVEVNPLP